MGRGKEIRAPAKIEDEIRNNNILIKRKSE